MAVRILGESIHEILQLTITGFTARTNTVSQTIQYYREEVMELSNIIKRQYVRKIHEDGRYTADSTLYTDISHVEEQLIDYCDMIAEALIRYNIEVGGDKNNTLAPDDRLRQQVHLLFMDKFDVLNHIWNEND